MASCDSDERTLAGGASDPPSRASSLDFEDPAWQKLTHTRRTTLDRRRNLRVIGICSAILLVVLVILSHVGTRTTSQVQSSSTSFQTEPWPYTPDDFITEVEGSPAKTPVDDEIPEPEEVHKGVEGGGDDERPSDAPEPDQTRPEGTDDLDDPDDPENSRDPEDPDDQEGSPEDDAIDDLEIVKIKTTHDRESSLEEDFQDALAIDGLEPGDLLTTEIPVVANKDRSHFLRLEKDGNLKLYRFVESGVHYNATELIWTLGSGNIDTKTIKNDNVMRLSEDGVLSVVQVFKQEKKGKRQSSEKLLWHSDLLPECKSPDPHGGNVGQVEPKFNILADGEIVIEGRCSIYTPPKKTAGKLALLVSGLYRTNAQVCKTHVEYIAENPGAERVDIFVYALYEEKDVEGDTTVEDLEQSIRDCYGHYLRTLTLKAESDVKEDYPDKVDSNCGRMHRINSQLKTLYLSGLDWWEWSVTRGVRHDSVLRVRTDHEFHGGDKPEFKPVEHMKGNELVMTPIAGGSPTPLQQHWFCSNPFGSVDIGKHNPPYCVQDDTNPVFSYLRSTSLWPTIGDAVFPDDVSGYS